MIQFSDIYERTVNLIDDPDINRAYLTNTIEFQKIMYNFLINGLSYFSNPIKVSDALAQYDKPTGETEIGKADLRCHDGHTRRRGDCILHRHAE